MPLRVGGAKLRSALANGRQKGDTAGHLGILPAAGQLHGGRDRGGGGEGARRADVSRLLGDAVSLPFLGQRHVCRVSCLADRDGPGEQMRNQGCRLWEKRATG